MNTAVFLNKKNFYGGNEIYGDIESPRKKYPLVILIGKKQMLKVRPGRCEVPENVKKRKI